MNMATVRSQGPVSRASRRQVVLCTAQASSVRAACPAPGLVQKAQLAAFVSAVWRQSPEAQKQDIKVFKQQMSNVNWMGAVVLPLAATTAAAGLGGQGEIYAAVAKAMDIYSAVLTVRILASWFKNINWFSEPWNTLRMFTDPFLNLFRGIIPPIGGMDLSPMLGFFLLSWVRNQVYKMSLYAAV